MAAAQYPVNKTTTTTATTKPISENIFKTNESFLLEQSDGKLKFSLVPKTMWHVELNSCSLWFKG